MKADSVYHDLYSLKLPQLSHKVDKNMAENDLKLLYSLLGLRTWMEQKHNNLFEFLECLILEE